MKRSNSRSASSFDFPFTVELITEADAFEIAQPLPVKLTSCDRVAVES